LKQNEIEAAAIMMRIFLTGLAFNFDAIIMSLKKLLKGLATGEEEKK
jgi:hypothetical protein